MSKVVSISEFVRTNGEVTYHGYCYDKFPWHVYVAGNYIKVTRDLDIVLFTVGDNCEYNLDLLEEFYRDVVH